MNHVVFISLSGGALGVLAGAVAGVGTQREVVARLSTAHADVAFLDFSGVDYASASYLREVIFGTRDALRRAGILTQIAVANANQIIQEEVHLVAGAVGSPVVHAIGRTPQAMSNAVVIGPVDGAQAETLKLVVKYGEVTATELTQEVPAVKLTAWNNRLASLAMSGLVVEGKRERHKVYRPILKGLVHGRGSS